MTVRASGRRTLEVWSFFLSRKLMAFALTSALLAGGISTSAQSAAEPGRQAPVAATASSTPKNSPPLKAGNAAGVREAQGANDRVALIASGVILAGIILAVVLIDDDDDSTSTTGSQ